MLQRNELSLVPVFASGLFPPLCDERGHSARVAVLESLCRENKSSVYWRCQVHVQVRHGCEQGVSRGRR